MSDSQDAAFTAPTDDPFASEDVEPHEDGGRRRPRRWLRRLAALTVMVVAFLAVTARLFFFPSIDQPTKVDAVVVLGGAGPRVAKGLELMAAGYSDELIVSEEGGTAWHWRDECFNPRPGFDTTCFDPDPSTTRGEARAIAALAERMNLKSIIVVASTDQVTRARLIVGRCYDGEIRMVDVDSDNRAWYQAAYEWGATVRATVFRRGC